MQEITIPLDDQSAARLQELARQGGDDRANRTGLAALDASRIVPSYPFRA